MILTFDAWSHTPGLAPWVGALTVLAVLFYGLASALRDTPQSVPADPAAAPGAFGLVGISLWAGWALHAALIGLDVLSAGLDTARFGFAPALSITAWLVLGVYGIENRFLPLTGARRALSLWALASVVLASIFPGEFFPHVAPWAPLHWVLGLASYGLFGAAVLHAVLLNRAERRLRQKEVALGTPGLPLLRLERLTFRFVEAGFGVLTAALLLGWWVSSPWRWDHKAVFSLLGWGVFAALLIGRHAFGWRGLQATRWLYVGTGLLLLGYVGSRFVLEVLMPAR
ncbi:MAG: cytochrome c biogenesis protein CcsA [Pseudomonadota bacterium]